MSTAGVTSNLLTIEEASEWASDYLQRDISEDNIAYLLENGRVKQYSWFGKSQVDIAELEEYYASFQGRREADYKEHLGDDINWELSFDYLREKDTTKHVHRLHPYKGKFIPQLAEYFYRTYTAPTTNTTCFEPGDVVLDPFAGSGTALVQAVESGMHAIGIDVSQFNCQMIHVKLSEYDFAKLAQLIDGIREQLAGVDNNFAEFEAELVEAMGAFNAEHFPSPDIKQQVRQGTVELASYGELREQEFLKTYRKLVAKYKVELAQDASTSFLDKWYCQSVRKEIDFVNDLVSKVAIANYRAVLQLILSRTIRSCRATRHSDLATLKEPQLTTYFCFKHYKICKPLYSIKYWFGRYCTDTLRRLQEFAQLRTEAQFAVLPGDSRKVNILAKTAKQNKALHAILQQRQIRGIFSSPPYVGQIDYHEQHAYAYDLFGITRNDDSEIGPLFKGKGVKARTSYVDGIANVLKNCQQYLCKDFDIFLVANDTFDLYPAIAEQAGMQIVHQVKRPVLNRTEKDRSPYAETIFHLKNLDKKVN